MERSCDKVCSTNQSLARVQTDPQNVYAVCREDFINLRRAFHCFGKAQRFIQSCLVKFCQLGVFYHKGGINPGVVGSEFDYFQSCLLGTFGRIERQADHHLKSQCKTAGLYHCGGGFHISYAVSAFAILQNFVAKGLGSQLYRLYIVSFQQFKNFRVYVIRASR